MLPIVLVFIGTAVCACAALICSTWIRDEPAYYAAMRTASFVLLAQSVLTLVIIVHNIH